MKKHLPAILITALIVGFAMHDRPDPEIIRVKETKEVPVIVEKVIEKVKVVEVEVPTPALNGKLDAMGMPTDSTTDNPGGFFQVPCQEDEIPTVVEDSERVLPNGVWFTCIHMDEYGEVMDFGWYAWDDEEGYLVPS